MEPAMGAGKNRKNPLHGNVIRQIRVQSAAQFVRIQFTGYFIQITSRAKNHIKNSIRTEKKKYFEAGKEKLKKYCKEMGIEFSKHFVHQLMEYNEMTNKTDLYYEIAVGTLTRQHLKNFYHKSGKNTWLNSLIPFGKQKAEVSLSKTIREKIKNKPEEVLLGEKEEVEYKIAKCCNPIPGDDVIGLIMPNNPIMIHRVN